VAYFFGPPCSRAGYAHTARRSYTLDISRLDWIGQQSLAKSWEVVVVMRLVPNCLKRRLKWRHSFRSTFFLWTLRDVFRNRHFLF